jgi:hypothetical protein
MAIRIIAGYIYRQKNKKRIIKGTVQNSIKSKTGSLYFVHYDGSQMDEINGDASFYEVTLPSDSAQKAMLINGDSLPMLNSPSLLPRQQQREQM